MFTLINTLIGLLLSFIQLAGDFPPILSAIYTLAVLFPSLALVVRRLHDIGRSGWWVFINLVPFIGMFIFLVFMMMDSQEGSNEYGPNPK